MLVTIDGFRKKVMGLKKFICNKNRYLTLVLKNKWNSAVFYVSGCFYYVKNRLSVNRQYRVFPISRESIFLIH